MGVETLETYDKMTGTMTHNILLTREKREQTDYIPRVGFQRTKAVVAMCRKRREGWLQRCPPFVWPGLMHAPTFCRMFCNPNVFCCIWFWSLSWCLKNKIRSQWEKFASSYNSFHIVQITILSTARIAKNTTRFSLWSWGKTLFMT